MPAHGALLKLISRLDEIAEDCPDQLADEIVIWRNHLAETLCALPVTSRAGAANLVRHLLREVDTGALTVPAHVAAALRNLANASNGR